MSTLREFVGKNPPPRSDRTPVEDRVGAMLPGDGEPEEHVVEKLVPSAGEIDLQMARAKAAHELAEKHPDEGAVLGEAIPDEGGETRPYEGGTPTTEGSMAPRRRRRDRVCRAGPRAAPKGPSARGFPIVKGD